MSDNDDLKCKTVGNRLFKKQRALLSKAKLNEAPSGAAIPKAPSPPKPPVAPVAAGKNPAGQAAKQSMQAAKGQNAKVATAPKAPKTLQIAKIPTIPKIGKSELRLSEKELYTDCEHCGTPQFTKTAAGPEYAPCACFMVTKSEKFVTLTKNESGYSLDFNPKSDPESVKAFLLALKAKLLVTKKFGDQ